MSTSRKVRVFLTILTTILGLGSTVLSYELNVPTEYIAFSGDLDVQYKIPDGVSLSDAFIRVALITDDGEEEITTLGINPKYQSGNQKVTCGVIEVAGKYEFQMYMYYGGSLLKRAVVIVRWPDVVLQLPKSHFAQSDSVQLKINSPAVCNPRLKRYGFEMQLEYADNSSAISITGNHEILYSKPFSNFSASTSFVEFPCSLFDLSGIYRASLISSFSAISVVSRSNSMLTTNNPAYKIHILSDTETIFPCNNGNLMITYQLPPCPGPKESNKIRIYMLRRKSSASLAAPREKVYVQERPADPDITFINPSCNLFKTIATGYCFQMVTLARHGVIINQTELCLSAHPDSVLPIDGGWSAWSQWSECSATCGSGEQSRYRMCDSPTPNFGGAFCHGDSIQRKHCEQFCPDSIPLTPLHSPNVDIACACGCHMTRDQGEIIASGRCSGTSKWLISLQKNYVINLRFKYLSFYQNKQWVKVRNGGTPESDLIAFTDGRNDIYHVTSTTNQMLIEFYTEPDNNGASRNLAIYPMKPEKPIHVHGFIAKFTSNLTDTSVVPLEAEPVRDAEEPSIWESTVTIVGIALCGLVVITAIAFVIYHRVCHTRQHKYAMAAHEESPKRMCKSTSMSTPSHESHHGIEIEHDMEMPLTRMKNGDKKRAKTPGSTRSKGSLSSTCSNKGKKLKTKADVEHGTSRTSPLTPNRDYSQIPQQDSSQLKKHRVHELTKENENNMSLFRTSPLSKPKVPRSPKVHPSPKLQKQQPLTSPSNDECDTLKTKHDFLSERFGNTNREKRVVMGSDHTPTNSVKSPPSDSSRTDCETPTNIDNGVKYRNHMRFKNSLQSDQNNHRERPNDITLSDLTKADKDTDRKPASGTSDDSTSADKDAGTSMTTSFIENGTKPRRPTSLTESYSKMSIASAISRGSIEGARNSNSIEGSKDKLSVTSSDDRQNALPKPDGQSPKSQRLETMKVESKHSSPTKTSKASTPRSVRSTKSDLTDNSNNTKSPARSINTPSDVIELEYDDFIDMDDTYSYFDPIVTEQLTFHGVERVAVKTPKTPNKETTTK